MLAHAEQFARAARYKTMVLGTSSLQPAAIALYRQAGCALASRSVNTEGSVRLVAGVESLRFVRALDP